MRLVCLDTQILIWGVQKPARSQREREMVRHATAFLKGLDQAGVKPFVPAIVVGELLCPVPVAKHAKALDVLSRGFVIGAFDAMAASQFATLWQLRKRDKTLEVLKNDATREELKADLMILATALSRKVPVLYTHDKPLTKLATGLIIVREVPRSQEQLELLLQS